MKDGFIKVAACSPKIRLADTKYNADRIIDSIREADGQGVKLLVFPELVLTDSTCGELFLQDALLDSVLIQLKRIIDETKECTLVSVIGAPLKHDDCIYNCAVVLAGGSAAGITVKRSINDQRYFSSPGAVIADMFSELGTCFGDKNTIYKCEFMEEFSFGVEIGGDCMLADSGSEMPSSNCARIIVNPAADAELIGSAGWRKSFAGVESQKTISAYIYCGAGEGESTTDMVFSGHSFIYENGELLAENEPFSGNGLLISEVDLGRLAFDRRKRNRITRSTKNDRVFSLCTVQTEYENYEDHLAEYKQRAFIDTKLTRRFDRLPFLPKDRREMHSRAESILMMQAASLKSRAEHIHTNALLIGISGGLDSCLALLACVKACDLMKVDRQFVHAVTMPCFGTTEHTKNNAVELCDALGVTLHTVPIAEAVRRHFSDIGHDEGDHDATYENAQARMRTLVLMDMANSLNGIVVGTGDLSELALGWATYNGDHMSMYGVNAGIPKTLIRQIVRSYAETCGDDRIREVLMSILDTPISPELLPAETDGRIAQKTEDLVGPYELHDFFLYYVVRYGYSPVKLYRVAKEAFRGTEFDDEEILKWLKNFYRRFFSQQFKRSCMPDGPKIGTVGLSPRGDWNMPSDANARIWLDELNTLE